MCARPVSAGTRSASVGACEAVRYAAIVLVAAALAPLVSACGADKPLGGTDFLGASGGPAARHSTERPDGVRPASADSDPPPAGRAILVSGPTRGKGIEFLGPNVIEHQRAEYRVTEGAVGVIYFEYRGEIWEPTASYRCGQDFFVEVATFDGTAHLYDGDGFRVFVTFPDGFDAYCAFLTPLLERLEFFRAATRGDPAVPFPAFLDLPR